MIKIRKEGDDMLTNILLLIIMIAGALFGMRLMGGIDFFLEEQKSLKDGKEPEYVLIFADRPEPELSRWFEETGLQVIFLDNMCLDPEWKQVRYLITLKKCDLDNLSACNLVKSFYPETGIFTVCNDRANRKLYRQIGAVSYSGKAELMHGMELLTLEHEGGAA